MQIAWDEPKRLANLDKHGMDFVDLTIHFFESAVVYPGKAGRFVAVSRLENKFAVAVIFRPLGSEAISVISMRLAGRKERNLL
jgi:uncharacterized DUF497 family protein